MKAEGQPTYLSVTVFCLVLDGGLAGSAGCEHSLLFGPPHLAHSYPQTILGFKSFFNC